MTREEAYARCPEDSYVEYYGMEWLIIPYDPVRQPLSVGRHAGSGS
jgi:hypothetical protein